MSESFLGDVVYFFTIFAGPRACRNSILRAHHRSITSRMHTRLTRRALFSFIVFHYPLCLFKSRATWFKYLEWLFCFASFKAYGKGMQKEIRTPPALWQTRLSIFTKRLGMILFSQIWLVSFSSTSSLLYRIININNCRLTVAWKSPRFAAKAFKRNQ